MSKYAELVSKKVIALEDSERLLNFKEQEYSKDFLVFKAFDGKKYGIPEEIDIKKYRQRIKRAPYPGEIGCSMSHYLLCKEFSLDGADSEKIMLVAEDDARFYKYSAKIIQRIIRVVDWDKTGIVVLASPGDEAGKRDIMSISQKLAVLSLFSKIVGWSKWYPFIVGNYYGSPLGTGMYLISQKAASEYVKLVEEDKISWHADDYNYWALKIGSKPMILRPGLASWEGESTIGGKEHSWKIKKDLNNKSVKEIISFRMRLRRTVDALYFGKKEMNLIWKKYR